MGNQKYPWIFTIVCSLLCILLQIFSFIIYVHFNIFLFPAYCLWPYLSPYVRILEAGSRDNLEPNEEYEIDKRIDGNLFVEKFAYYVKMSVP